MVSTLLFIHGLTFNVSLKPHQGGQLSHRRSLYQLPSLHSRFKAAKTTLHHAWVGLAPLAFHTLPWLWIDRTLRGIENWGKTYLKKEGNGLKRRKTYVIWKWRRQKREKKGQKRMLYRAAESVKMVKEKTLGRIVFEEKVDMRREEIISPKYHTKLNIK